MNARVFAAAVAEPETQGDRSRRARWTLLALAAGLLAVAVLSLGQGALPVPPDRIVGILASAVGLGDAARFNHFEMHVVLHLRLPRLLLAMLVGSALAVSGAALQGLFRNPLADPGLVGVSAGAALGAVTVIVLGATWLHGMTAWLGIYTLPIAAFIGGLAATLLVYRLAQQGGYTPVATLLLAGIAINAVAGAGTGLLTFIADDQQLRSLTFWTMGSLGGASWSNLAAAAPLILLPMLALPVLAMAMNAFLLGESVAQHLGVRVEHIKILVVTLTAMAVGAAVAVSGIIGFVGLVVPHLLRLWMGPDHRYLLPGSALLGAFLLLLADLLARNVVAPAELPIGLITALVGGPFFLALLLRRRGMYS
ncbi:FecCD family ABC transporter permease [Thioalkalivibrio sp.]|uniref:FecCD family ABC transporter permease n=1 Tax=Thioalkalivibrio sp. TaxID=2093813 RepID=UPI00356333B6